MNAEESPVTTTLSEPISSSPAPAITQEQINLIRNSVARNCTYDELMMLLHTSRKYDLDPLLKEIWCIKYDQRQPAQIFVSYHGLLAIANRTGLLDGIETEIEYGEDRVILGATSTVWKKGCDHPFRAHVQYREFNNPNNQLWKLKPEAMITKVSEVHALRKAFSISGLYISEEIALTYTDITPEDNPGESPKQRDSASDVFDAPKAAPRKPSKPPAPLIIKGI